MKRRLFLLAVVLLIGAAVNVAVAYAGFGLEPDSRFHETGTVLNAWPRPVPPDWPAPAFTTIRNRLGATYLWIESRASAVEPTVASARIVPACDMIVYRIGLPFRSLGMYATTDHRPSLASKTYIHPVTTFHGIVRLPDELQARTHLPWFPIRALAAGFIANTILYGAMAWALGAGVVAFRRSCRRRRGLCARCGYPVGVSPVCTECGAALVHGGADGRLGN